MSTPPNDPTLEALAARVAALEQALASLQPHSPTPATPPPASTVVEQPTGTRRFLRQALAAAASLVGARLTGSSKTALAAESRQPGTSSPCVCSSDVATAPAVQATGTNGADGVDASSDSGTGLSASSTSGTGLLAISRSFSGLGAHVVGGGASVSAFPVPSTGAAIFAEGGPNYGLYATSDSGYGVWSSSPFTGIAGISTSGTGVHGQSTSHTGVFAQSTSGTGVFAQSTSGLGVDASSDSGTAVSASSNSGTAVLAQSTSGTGLHAVVGGASPTTPPGLVAIYAQGGPGYGLYATSNSSYGVAAFSYSHVGVGASSTSGYGVYGSSNSGTGVFGQSYSGTGVVGSSTNGYAGYFVGSIYVSGPLQKPGGGFQIDHPLDAAHKYLCHSFVESADMKNLYDGVVTLDANGQAEVRLPAWFETLNTDFRYQLTCLGSYAPVYIAEKLQHNRFTIAGGQAGMEVSWQVTGIRQDRWANAHRMPIEQDKPAEEQGYYLHPDLYGEPEEKSVHHARFPDLQRPAPPQN